MDASETLRWARPRLILVATDLYDLNRLMPFAINQALESGARLILLHVLGANGSISTDAAGLPYYDTSSALEFADHEMRSWCEEARCNGISCDTLVREGTPAQQISTAARQFQADRVLLGTRSRSKLSKLLLGSVAEQVLRSVNLPVVTVGPEAHLPVGECGENVVLHATTLRETSRPSAALACQIAAARKQTLLLLHVLPTVDEMEQDGISVRLDSLAMIELLDLAAEIHLGPGGKIETLVVHGNPSGEILAWSAERHASLMVLAATSCCTLENLNCDRTIYRVLARARCPVLTLREPLRVQKARQIKSVAASVR